MGKKAAEALEINYDDLADYLHKNHSVYMRVDNDVYYLTDVNYEAWRAQDTSLRNSKNHFVDCSDHGRGVPRASVRERPHHQGFLLSRNVLREREGCQAAVGLSQRSECGAANTAATCPVGRFRPGVMLPRDGKVRWQAHVISPPGQEISARLAGRRIQTRPDAAESHPEKLYATKSAVMCGSDPFHGRSRIIPRWPSIEPILISAGRSYIN